MNLKTALDIIDPLTKGGKRAVVGEIRTFGGREYIRTNDGWKFHGKGTGKKAQEHKQKATGGQKQFKGFADAFDHFKLGKEKEDQIREILRSDKTDQQAYDTISQIAGKDKAKVLMEISGADSKSYSDTKLKQAIKKVEEGKNILTSIPTAEKKPAREFIKLNNEEELLQNRLEDGDYDNHKEKEKLEQRLQKVMFKKLDLQYDITERVFDQLGIGVLLQQEYRDFNDRDWEKDPFETSEEGKKILTDPKKDSKNVVTSKEKSGLPEKKEEMGKQYQELQKEVERSSQKATEALTSYRKSKSPFSKKYLDSANRAYDTAVSKVESFRYNHSGIISVLKKNNISASTTSSTAIRGYRTNSSGYEIDRKLNPNYVNFYGISKERIGQIAKELDSAGFKTMISGTSIKVEPFHIFKDD